MAEALGLVGAPLVKKLIDLVEYFCAKKYNEIYGVEGDIEDLKSNLSSIQALLEDAESCTRKSKRLEDWLKKLRNASLDAEDVLETYVAEAAAGDIRHGSLMEWLLSRRTAGREINKIVQRIIIICGQRDRLDVPLQNHSTEGTGDRPVMNYRENLPYRSNSRVYGREKEKDEIIEWLLSGESSTIPGRIPVVTITGMPGVGKTTLAQLVYSDKRVFKLNDEDPHVNNDEKRDEDLRSKKAKKKDEGPSVNNDEKKDEDCGFKKAAWVNVSADFNLDKILKDIAYMLTEVVHPGGPRNSIVNFIDKALDRNPLFLVLDDVWDNEKLAWQELDECLRKFPNGTKVLATSRDNTVARLLGAIESYDLPMLTEEHCLRLFLEQACSKWETVFSQQKIEIGKEIITKCQFLPLAVKVMGAILRGREIKWWRTLNTDIWNAVAFQGKGLSSIRPILILSFDALSPTLKECFAYTSLFPKSYMFDKHELVKLWIAEGFIQNSMSWTLEQLGGDYFDTLCNKSFFQFLKIDRKERFQMHDLMHDLAKHVSFNSQRVERMNDSIDTTCRHVSFLCKDNDESTINKLLRAQKLRTILLPVSTSGDLSSKVALEKMFKTLSFIRVLDLSSSRVTELPGSIKQLKLLRYLDLSRNEISLLPTGICKLLNLQILRLVGCTHLQELPNDFANLKDLRHLELDDMFWKGSKLPPSLGQLTNLRNLHHFRVYRERQYGIDELMNMNSIEGLLHISNLENADRSSHAQLSEKKGLDKLILEWSKVERSPRDQMMSEVVLQDLRPHQNLQELQIEQYKGFRLSRWMEEGVLQNLYKISLNHCVNCTSLGLGHLPYLKVLHIKGMLKLEDWPENNSFPFLITLTISHCPCLLSLPNESFPQVQVLKIKGCNALQTVPVMSSVKFLTLVNNEDLQKWSGISKSPQRKQPLLVLLEQSSPSYCGLVEVEMVNCPRLMTLPTSSSFQKLKIRECPSLKALPNSQRLQYLEVDSLRLIETVQMSPSLDELAISNIPFLPKLPNFPSLRSLHIHNCQELQLGLLSNFTSLKFLSISECTIFPNNGLPTSIERLVIKKCSNLQSMHGTNNSYLTILSTLKDLYLEDCPRLESLPENGLPNSLQYLCIRGCPRLTVQCREGGRYLNMISNVAHLELD